VWLILTSITYPLERLFPTICSLLITAMEHGKISELYLMERSGSALPYQLFITVNHFLKVLRLTNTPMEMSVSSDLIKMQNVLTFQRSVYACLNFRLIHF